MSSPEEMGPHGESFSPPASPALQRLVAALVLLVTGAFTLLFILGAARSILYEPWVLEVAREQFAATIGLPFAAVAALCLVLLLEIRSGPIEFEGLGFKFHGASGPVILWALSFLTIVGAVKLLWK